MEGAFLLIILSGLLVGWGIAPPIRVWMKRRALGIPWRFGHITAVTEKSAFPRSLFRMEGQTGGPLPLKAPLSGKDCYYYEVNLISTGPLNRSITHCLLQAHKQFTFFSPKGAVTLNPLDFTRDLHLETRLERGSRFPLPLVLREKIQRHHLEDGTIEERILPAFQTVQLVGKVSHADSKQFRLKKGPGVFPLISAEPHTIKTFSASGVGVLSSRQMLLSFVLMILGITGLYFAQQYLLTLP